jgi:hypothetical protein
MQPIPRWSKPDGSETKYPIMSGFGEDAPSNKWKAKRLRGKAKKVENH